MNRLSFCLSLVIVVVVVGCSRFNGPERAYLRMAQDHATQDEVTQQLGPPLEARSLETGGSLWRYEYYGYNGGDRNTPGQIWCDHYSLTFDNQAVLRHWDHRWDRTCLW